jgi:hypothetical protein
MKFQHSCDRCKRVGQEQKSEAYYEKNPFMHDVHEEIVMEWLCAECHQSLCDDI